MRPRGPGLLVAIPATLLALAAPWPFASVEPTFYGLLSALLLALAAVVLAAAALRRGAGPPFPRPVRRLVVGALAIPAVGLLTVVPLPRFVVGVLSPSTMAALETAAPPLPADWLPLSLHAEATLDAAIVAAAFAAVLLIVALAAARGGASALAWTFVAGGLALAVFGLVYRVLRPDPTVMFWNVQLNETGTPFGSYVNRNHFGGAMLLFVGVALGLAAAARRRTSRVAAVVATGIACLLVVAILASTSRGALVGLCVLAAGLVAAAPPRARRRLVVGVAMAGVLGLLAVAALGLLGDLASRADLQPRWSSRFLVQRDALRVFLSFPLAGTGAGTFESVYPAFQTIADDRHFGGAHSDWAQFLMETGLLGAAAGYLLLSTLAGRVRDALRTALTHPSGALAAGTAAGLAGLCAHGLFETNLHIPANALLAAVAAGLAWGAATEALGQARAEAAVSSPPGLVDDDQGGAPSADGGGTDAPGAAPGEPQERPPESPVDPGENR